MERASTYELLNQIQMQQISLKQTKIQNIVLLNQFFKTPTGTTCRSDIKTAHLKGEDDAWLLIFVVNKKHVPAIYLKEEF